MPRRLIVALLAVVVAAVLVTLEVFREVNTTRLVVETTTTSKLTGELRILQISDFHMLDNRGQVDDIIRKARGTDPDIIMFSGDLINRRNTTLEPMEWLLSGISEIGVPMYAVLGNHDHWSTDLPTLLERYAYYGVDVVRNEYRLVEGAWGTMILIGVDDPATRRSRFQKAIFGAPEGFRFVLAHAPEIRRDLEDAAYDYAIVGHTHGGQVALPFIGALVGPGQGFFPEYSRGFYEIGGGKMYIDSGVGASSPTLRFGVQSQITLHVFRGTSI